MIRKNIEPFPKSNVLDPRQLLGIQDDSVHFKASLDINQIIIIKKLKIRCHDQKKALFIHLVGMLMYVFKAVKVKLIFLSF